MRIAAVICSVLLALIAASATASARSTSIGVLKGSTKIESGCAVPSHSCQQWQLYPNAQFTLTRLSATGAALTRTTHTLESNAEAQFQVRLRSGSYLIKPVAGKTTKGGSPLRVRVEAPTTKAITVRFIAKYQPA